ncbi:MAG: tetratricopeptide repeat protein [Oligoflexales bacterium]
MTFDVRDKTLEQVNSMVLKVRTKEALSEEEISNFLNTFESYECWTPYLMLLSSKLDISDSPNKKDYYISYIKTQNIHLKNSSGALSMCKRMIKDLNLSFMEFWSKVLPEISLKQDHESKAAFLKTASTQFKTIPEQVACLEHLGMIYDKKIHLEHELPDVYEKILELDPSNVKALKYFKAVFTQTGSWEEVAGALGRLLKAVSHKNEEYRVAQELAGVFLYQLNNPQKAIDVLEKYCAQSPLDTSTIHYDAYASLQDWSGCLKVLNRCILTTEEDTVQATLYYRIGQLHAQLGNNSAADSSLQKSLELWPQFLEPLEELIHIAVDKKDWPTLKKYLETLENLIQGEDQKRKVASLIDVIKGCLGNEKIE